MTSAFQYSTFRSFALTIRLPQRMTWISNVTRAHVSSRAFSSKELRCWDILIKQRYVAVCLKSSLQIFNRWEQSCWLVWNICFPNDNGFFPEGCYKAFSFHLDWPLAYWETGNVAGVFLLFCVIWVHLLFYGLVHNCSWIYFVFSFLYKVSFSVLFPRFLYL